MSFIYNMEGSKINAQGVAVKRQLKNSDTVRITRIANCLQIVFNAKRREKSIVVHTKNQMTSRQK